ncbi:Alpha/beta hydrolase fold-1 [Hypoxylon sp. FL0543]|nr:Alpha/beta hydrolase fold-1 [Hypoxylon sp. FL0543]
MSDSPKRGIIFSVGAFHPAHFLDPVKQLLENGQTFDPVLVSSHPSLGNDSRGKTLWDDVEALRKQMAPHVDAGCEFIIVGHSYGGFPGFEATEGWTVAERAAAGKKGGVRAVVFNTATVPIVRGGAAMGVFEEGKELVYPPFMEHKDHLAYPTKISKQSFYNDIDDAKAQELYDTLLPHSQVAIETPANYIVSDANIPYYYIVTEKDEAVPAEIQRTVAAAVPGCTTLSIDAGHTAFYSQPARFVELLERIAGEVFSAETK